MRFGRILILSGNGSGTIRTSGVKSTRKVQSRKSFVVLFYLFATNYIEKQQNIYQQLQYTVIFKTKCPTTNWYR